MKHNEYLNREFDFITHKMYSVAKYINNNYSETLSLQQLAGQFYISSCYLSRKFKEITGYNLIQFIQQTRAKNAQKKLISTKKNIQEISEACGFASFSQFNRIFKQYSGMTPSQYRKKNRVGNSIFSEPSEELQ